MHTLITIGLVALVALIVMAFVPIDGKAKQIAYVLIVVLALVAVAVTTQLI